MKTKNTSFLANQIGPIYCDPRITRNKEKGKESKKKKKKKLAFVFGCKDEEKEKRGNASYTFIILN